nr:hypothetical protein [Novosphingobium pentaromativorans]
MLKLHDELITELSNSLTTQNYNPVVVANHRLYARAFLDYLAECDIQVETVTPQQVDQYFGYAFRILRSSTVGLPVRVGTCCPAPRSPSSSGLLKAIGPRTQK